MNTTPRALTSHVVNPVNDQIQIEVADEPGAGGANHDYVIILPKRVSASGATERSGLRIQFQNGPIAENGVNGITQEVLLAIVEDRLKSFQAGPYACRENALALTHLQEAMHWLHHRTRERMARGVEGTHQK